MSQATLGSGPYRNSSLFSGYYLDERIADLDDWESDDEAEAAFEALRDLWELEGDYVATHGEDELIDQWIGEVLEILGFDTISEGTLPDGGGYVDRLLYESKEARYKAADRKREGDREGMFSGASALLEAKQWGHDFERRFSDERPYRDASHQVKYYLERTPTDLDWGILTDGKKWRLYGTKDYETQTYYEVDLPELLESGDLQQFKYFYCFFRPEAFVEVAGSSFLETVWSESETAAQELGEDLQDNVFTALRVLGKGFVENNDLAIDPEDEAERDELKEQSLVLLYRLMFVLYAESRGLIDPEEPDANAEYHENFSLEEVRSDVIETVEGGDVESGDVFREEYSTFSTTIWNRLTRLFELIDEGAEALDIPPYNGGLFDHDDHEFLAENEVSDPEIAEVIFRLSTTENDEGEYVPADYADLDTRHLGSIYEGLLEHEFRIAGPEGVAAVSEDGGQVWKPGDEVSVAEAVEVVDEGGLYVVNDEGERKATGAYYTPDYVVTYIVEETVDPLIDEIDADLREQGLKPSDGEYFVEFYDAVLDLTILDPAMGSGHFLTKATGYLTEQVMGVVREQEIQSYDEQEIRRDISKEVIYGVDLNGMAVELSKLSMWLETLAADQPLAFLDHHLKTGNSLVGSDITEVLSDDTEENGGQLTLTQAFARVRQDTLEHVMELMSELLAFDNDSLESVKSMEELYDEIRDDPLYGRLFELANVHTAEEFGCDVPDDAYEQMAGAIEDEDDWAEIAGEDWFTAAQATAEEQDFFHWELEFPEVFFDLDGEKLAGAGFDAVVGNPPYVRQEQIKGLSDLFSKDFEVYSPAADLYTYFIEQGHKLLSEDRHLGYIVSNKFTRAEYGKPLREYMLENTSISTLCDFHDLPVFGPTISAYPMITIFKNSDVKSDNPVSVVQLDSLEFTSLRDEIRQNSTDLSQSELSKSAWSLTGADTIKLYNKISSQGTPLEEYLEEEILRGILTGLNEAFIIDGDTRDEIIAKNPESERFIHKLLKGGNAKRYLPTFSGQYLILVESGWTKSVSGIDSEASAWDWFSSEYPGIASHLKPFQEEARTRYDRGEYWWELRPCDYYESFKSAKIVYPEISDGPKFSIDRTGFHTNNKCFMIPTVDRALVGILNSSLGEFWAKNKLSSVRGGYLEYRRVHLSEFPVQETTNAEIANNVDKITELTRTRRTLNTDLLAFLGTSVNGPGISELGLLQPTKRGKSQILKKTKQTYPNLRVGTATVDRESPNTVLIKATARYKPDDEDAYETDRWGYTETDPLPAFRITDLTATEADLIEHFVPVAVDEAGGFANFRETATKTNSLVDRLKAIELPDVDDVADDLANYLETVERAEELDAKIEKTDALIDEIVYELYGLTDEEIAIVEESVD